MNVESEEVLSFRFEQTCSTVNKMTEQQMSEVSKSNRVQNFNCSSVPEKIKQKKKTSLVKTHSLSSFPPPFTQTADTLSPARAPLGLFASKGCGCFGSLILNASAICLCIKKLPHLDFDRHHPADPQPNIRSLR